MFVSSPVLQKPYGASNIKFEGFFPRRKPKKPENVPEFQWKAMPYRVEKLKRDGPYGLLNLREVNQLFLQEQLRAVDAWPTSKKQRYEIQKDISKLQFLSSLYDTLLIETLKEATPATIIDFQHKRFRQMNGSPFFSMPLPPDALKIIKQKLEEAKQTPDIARLLAVMPDVPDITEAPEKKDSSFKKAAVFVLGTLVAEHVVKGWIKRKF